MGIILAYWKTGYTGVINGITRHAKAELQIDFTSLLSDLFENPIGKLVFSSSQALVVLPLSCWKLSNKIKDSKLRFINSEIQFAMRFHKDYFSYNSFVSFFTFLHFWHTRCRGSFKPVQICFPILTGFQFLKFRSKNS